ELLFQIGPGFAHPASARSCARSGRTKLAAARWAICRFARQGHLVGTVTVALRPASQGSSLSIVTKPHDELAPLYSITPSARASRVGGTSRPSARAVLRLMRNSNLVWPSTGRSKGLVPFNILST